MNEKSLTKYSKLCVTVEPILLAFVSSSRVKPLLSINEIQKSDWPSLFTGHDYLAFTQSKNLWDTYLWKLGYRWLLFLRAPGRYDSFDTICYLFLLKIIKE